MWEGAASVARRLGGGGTRRTRRRTRRTRSSGGSPGLQQSQAVGVRGQAPQVALWGCKAMQGGGGAEEEEEEEEEAEGGLPPSPLPPSPTSV